MKRFLEWVKKSQLELGLGTWGAVGFIPKPPGNRQSGVLAVLLKAVPHENCAPLPVLQGLVVAKKEEY